MAARPGGGALAHFREERRAQVLTAEGVAQAAVARAEETQRALVLAREESQDLQQQLTAAQADFARAQGEATALQRQVEAGAEQCRELQGALNTSQQRFTEELEQQRAAAALAVERHAADTRRLLLDVDVDVDRERRNSARRQKELDLARRVTADESYGASATNYSRTWVACDSGSKACLWHTLSWSAK